MSHQCTPACTAGWLGPSRKCHCRSCGSSFTTPGNFDKHRRNGECLTPEQAGLAPNKRGLLAAPGETDFDDRFGR